MLNNKIVDNNENTKEILGDLDTAIQTHKTGKTTEAANIYKKTWYRMETNISEFDPYKVKTCILGLLKGYLVVGDYLSAQDLLVKLENIKELEPSGLFLSQLFYLKGWVAMKRTDVDSAICFFHNSIDLNPNYIAYKALYYCYIKKYSVQLALAALFKCITLSSEENAEQYIKDITNLVVLLNKNKYKDIGLQYMEAVINKGLLNRINNKVKFGFLFNFAEQNFLLKKYQEAEQSCDKLMELLDSSEQNNETKKWKLFVTIKKVKILNLNGKKSEANTLKLSIYNEKTRLNGSLLFICGHYVSSSNVKIAEQLLKKNPKDIYALLVVLFYNLESYKGKRNADHTLKKIKVYVDRILDIDNTNINAILCLIHACIFKDNIKEAYNLYTDIHSGRKLRIQPRNIFEFKLTGAQILACFKDNSIINKFRECESLTSNTNERAEIIHYIVNSFRKNNKKYQEAIDILENFMGHWDKSLDNTIKIFTKFVYSTILLQQLSSISDNNKYKMIIDKVDDTLKDLFEYKPTGTRIFKTVTDEQILECCEALKDYLEKGKDVMNNKIKAMN